MTSCQVETGSWLVTFDLEGLRDLPDLQLNGRVQQLIGLSTCRHLRETTQ